MRYALFWDVDGTLLTTGRAGILALEEAVREVLQADADLRRMRTTGLTDHQVAALAIEAAGAEATPAVIDSFLRSYELHLPNRLRRRRGHVTPGVRDILDHLSCRDDTAILLLTGNTPAGAEAKLRHYGLGGYFGGGAFCLGAGGRDAIARRARALAREAEVDRVYVIGDTPADISCGKHIGAFTVALAGTYDIDALECHDPWLALEHLPSPRRFTELLGMQPRNDDTDRTKCEN